MKALRLGHPELLPATVEQDIPQPHPGRGEILIRIHAAGVTPTEIMWYPTTHTKAGQPRKRAIPGHEFSGVVSAIGTDVSDIRIGQDVFGLNDWFADGATAEYCITQPKWIVPKPSRLSHAQAASVPIGALTAWQGLFDRAKLQGGERVLIHGGSGAVGVFAVQLAKRHGAQVIATASTKNLEFVKQLGADQAIDYRNQRFEKIVANIDVVFDTVGGETLERSWGILKPGGRLVTIAAQSEATADARTKQAFFIVEGNQIQLTKISQLLDADQLKPVVDCIVPFDQAPQAYAQQVKQRSGRGKVVIAVVS